MKSIVCPQCQKKLPDNYEGRYCPHCGAVFAITVAPPVVAKSISKSPPLAQLPEQRAVGFKMSWLGFFIVFLVPPLLASIVAFLGYREFDEQFPPTLAAFGGVGSGIVCGIMLALRQGKTSATKVLLGFLYSAVLIVVCNTLCYFACLTGYQLGLR